MLNPKASIVTLTYFGAEKTIEGYNAMGIAKAALQSSIRYLAKEIGDVASFLFSDMSNAITGEVIHADNVFSTVAV